MILNIDNIIIKLLYIVFIVTSSAAIITNDYIDDVILLIVGLLLFTKIIKKIFVNNKHLLLLFFIIFEFLSLYTSMYQYHNYSILSALSLLKISILLLLPFYIKTDEHKKNNIFNNLLILSLPNLIMGIFQFIQAYIFKIHLVGKYEVISGAYLYRIQGLTGHPLYYSTLMICLILILMYNTKIKYRNILIVLCYALCVLTHSIFFITIATILIIIKLLLKNEKIMALWNKYSLFMLWGALILALLFIYMYMFKEQYTIRYVATRQTLLSTTITTFFTGNGFGSYLASNYSEAYIFRVFYENGIIGIIILLGLIFSLLFKQLKKNNFSGLFICFIYILNIFINEGYIIPFIIFIPFICIETKIFDNKKLGVKE